MAYASRAKRSAIARAVRIAHWALYYIWLGLLAVRVAVVVALLCLIAFNMIVIAAHAQAAAAKPNYAKAYDYALRCFVVSGWQNHDQRSKAAFDAGVKLGKLQGFGNDRINADFEQAIAVEGVKIVQHTDYRDDLLVACRKLGWAN